MAEDNSHQPSSSLKQDSPTSQRTVVVERQPILNIPPPVIEEPLVSSPTARERVLRLLPLLTLTGIALLWATLDEIPIEVVGRSVLILPRDDLEVQSRAAGKILQIHVRPGDTVKIGQLLVTLDLPELKKELSTHQQKLAQLQGENIAITTVEKQRTQLKRETLQRQTQSIGRNLGSLRSQYGANLRQIEADTIQIEANNRQHTAYNQRIEQLRQINKLIRNRLNAFEKLIGEGVVASLSPDLIRAVQAEQDNQNTITTLFAKIEDIQADNEQQQAQIKTLKAQNKSLTAQIQNQQAGLEDIKTQNRQQDLDDLTDDIKRFNAIADQQRSITNLKTQIATESRIYSTKNGKIIDIAVNPSQYIEAGTRIGTLQVSSPEEKTIGITFFQVGDADRIYPGMEMEIIPDIQRRERYGGIVATVLKVSPETITPQEVASVVGNEELAKKLDTEQPVVQITAELHRDPTTISGYQWTQGKGAPQKLPNSATATARVEVERRSLLSYLIPVWRRITGIYSR